MLGEIRRLLPFELLGFDTDNDSVFVNKTVRDYCRNSGIVFTRCRPWHKNDQAFVEQKNGAVVRRVVGYRRLEGLEAAAALSRGCTVERVETRGLVRVHLPYAPTQGRNTRMTHDERSLCFSENPGQS